MAEVLTVAQAQTQVDAARASGDRGALAGALVVLGAAQERAGQVAEGITSTEEAVAVYRTLGSPDGLMWGLENLATRYTTAGQYGRAVATTQERVEYYRASGDRGALAGALVVLGAAQERAGQVAEGITSTEEAVAVYRTLGSPDGLMWGLENLATRYTTAGQYGRAVATTQERVEYYRASGDRGALAGALVVLGAAQVRAGQVAEGITSTEEAVAVYRTLGSPDGLMWGLENLATRYTTAGQYGRAVATTQERVEYYRASGDRGALAGALVVLGAAQERAGQVAEGITSTEEAVAVYRTLGSPDGLMWGLENLATRYTTAGQHQAAELIQKERHLHLALPHLGYAVPLQGPSASTEEAMARYLRIWLPDSVDLPFAARIEAIAAHLTGRFCGVPDDLRRGADGVYLLSYGAGEHGSWPRGNLTWSFDPAQAQMPVGTIQRELSAAFTAWANVPPWFFTFTQVAGNGDIRIAFGGEELEEEFGGPGGVLAMGGFPNTISQGEINVDQADPWTWPGGAFQVIAHEIGHTLGLGHSPTRGTLMFPAFSGVNAIQPEDAAALHRLYGWEGPARAVGDSRHRPALAPAGEPTFIGEPAADRLYLAWRGIGDDVSIYWSQHDGATWTAAASIPGHWSSHGPAMASIVFGGSAETGLLMVHNGGIDDTAVYYSGAAVYGTVPQWTQRRVVEGGLSINTGPALAVGANRACLAYKGLEDDRRIHWSLAELYDSWRPGDYLNWQHKGPIRSVETSDAPVLVHNRGTLYLFWVDAADNSLVYYASLDLALLPNAVWSQKRKVQYISAETSGDTWVDVHASWGPSATVRDNYIELAWTPPGDRAIYVSQFDGTVWSGRMPVRNFGTGWAPAIGEWDDQLFVVSVGGADDGLFYSRLASLLP